MGKLIHAFCRDESGATAIEYGLLAALISVAAIAAMTSLGDSLNTLFTRVDSAMLDAVNSSSG